MSAATFMSHLAVQVQDYIATHPGESALQLQNRACLKRGTIDSILRDQHPRPERFGQLLRAVDDATAKRWLVAYLKDDCPPEYLPRLQITIAAIESGPDSVAEAVSAYLVPDHSPSAVQAAWARLQAAISADTSLARWFVKTVNLILGPE
jgi:hypothetical protein